VVTLIAEADSGSVFGSWSVAACGFQTDCTFTVDTDMTVTATFNFSTGPPPTPTPLIPEPTTLIFFGIGLLSIPVVCGEA
jgi:hypothetical protein